MAPPSKSFERRSRTLENLNLQRGNKLPQRYIPKDLLHSQLHLRKEWFCWSI